MIPPVLSSRSSNTTGEKGSGGEVVVCYILETGVGRPL